MAPPFAPLVPTDELVVSYQRESRNLVVYSRLLGQVVVVAWPTHNGTMIVPSGMRLWLRNHGLFLECFCAFTAAPNSPRACQIVESSVTHHVLVFCHFNHPRCDFKLNLSKIYETTTLKSDYMHLPSLNSGGVPDMDLIRTAHRMRHVPVVLEIAPYFKEYFGEHISEYPAGTQQLSGPLLYRKPKNNSDGKSRRRPSAPYVRHQLQAPRSNRFYHEIDDDYPEAASRFPSVPAPLGDPFSISAPGPSRTRHSDMGRGLSRPQTSLSAPVAGPSRISTSAITRSSQEEREIRLLGDLAAGRGISEWSWDKGSVVRTPPALLLVLRGAPRWQAITARRSPNKLKNSGKGTQIWI
ncbi:hypothetical protein B0H15DRAFT_807689 [Mycena belliarum]|uniref:Uncharacterized protein n=1 Tax=Mycena belliarum TaxID=1033014 RepID=A0AAD6TLM2_9AGAR|nr:hypothetical protein B0H15DRAFT_807689 [Mycena belliae]